MITCTLKDKKYAVDFISGRALREMEPAAKMYAKIVALSNAAVKGEEIPQDEQISVTDAMDVMIRWFCLLFGNQFSPDDVLDGYPVDRLMHDIALALMAVQTQTTEILSQFEMNTCKDISNNKAEQNDQDNGKSCCSDTVHHGLSQVIILIAENLYVVDQ